MAHWVEVEQQLYCKSCEGVSVFRRYVTHKGTIYCMYCDEEKVDALDG